MKPIVAALCLTLLGSRSALAEPQLNVPHPDMRARWGFLFVPVNPSDGCPVKRADTYLAELQATCNGFAAQAHGARTRRERRGYAQLAEECVRKYVGLYAPLLQKVYSRADFDAVVSRMRQEMDPSRLECLLASSHNARVEAEIERKQAEWDAAARNLEQSEARDEATLRRAEEAAAAAERRNKKPSVGELVAIFLQGLGQGMAASSRGPQLGGTASSAGPEARRPTCSSDFECDYGSACVKAPYEMEGYCARKVDRFGTPTFSGPSTDSVMPGGPGQCAFDVECPLGFRCAKEQGALRGACLKD